MVVAVGYLVAGGTAALGPLLHARTQHNRTSIWQLPTWLLTSAGVTGHGAVLVTEDAALVGIAVIATLLVMRSTGSSAGHTSEIDASAAVIAGAATLVFLLASPYVLPWYSAWALPVLALVWRFRVAAVAVVQAALSALAYAAPIPVHGVWAVYARGVVPITSVSLLGYLVWTTRRGRLPAPARPALPGHLEPQM